MRKTLKIGIIGDYDGTRLSHRATEEALRHSGAALSKDIDVIWLETEGLAGGVDDRAGGFDGMFCAPGGAYKNYAGAMNAVRYAREQDIPFLGTCSGFQCAVMEFAQNALGMSDVYHQELNPDAPSFVVRALSCSLAGQTAAVILKEGSVCHGIYGNKQIMERFNCNYGLDPMVLGLFDEKGFKAAGTDMNGEVRILEIPEKRFFVAALFQPQLSSTPERPHRLLNQFLRVAANDI